MRMPHSSEREGFSFPPCGIVLHHFHQESDVNKKIFTPLNSTCNFKHNLPIKLDIVCINPGYLLAEYLTGAVDPVKIRV